jgi:hypothetical protein
MAALCAATVNMGFATRVYCDFVNVCLRGAPVEPERLAIVRR